MTTNEMNGPVNPTNGNVPETGSGVPLPGNTVRASHRYGLLMVVTLLLLASALVFGLWFFDRDRIPRAILKNLSTVSAHTFALHVNIQSAREDSDKQELMRLPVRLDVNGRRVRQELGIDDIEAGIKLSGKYITKGASIPIDTALDVRIAGGNAYVKIAKVPQILSLKFGADAMSLLGKWVELRDDTQDELLGIPRLLLRLDEQAPNDHAFLRNAFTKNFPFVLTPSGVEHVDADEGVLLRYVIATNKAKVGMIAEQLQQALEAPGGHFVLLNSSNAGILVRALTDVSGELYVGKDDLLPRRLTLTFPLSATLADKTLRETVALELTLGNFNNSPRILTPSLSTPVSKVQEDYTDRELIKSRDETRIADIRRLQTALEQYFDINGHYPIYAQKHADTLKVLVPAFISQIPLDPMDRTPYTYNAPGDGRGFFLGASLEDPNNNELLYDDDGKSGAWAAIGRDSMGCAMQQHRYCFNVSHRAPKE